MEQASRAAAVMPSSSHTEKEMAPSPTINSVVVSGTRQIVPFRVKLIRDSLSPIADNEIKCKLISASFLDSFLIYRDTLPLTPGVTPPNLPNDTATVNAFAKRIYEMMDAMHICTYDRTSSRAMDPFTAEQHLECLIYQACRDLASPEALFGDFFKREYLRKKIHREHAMNKIKGFIMVVCNLILRYTVLPPTEFVRGIEKLRPSKNPELSPIPEVRAKAMFDSMVSLIVLPCCVSAAFPLPELTVGRMSKR